MPVIQQENGVKTVKGLPQRWGQKAVKELAALLPANPGEPVSQQYKELSALLDAVIDAPLPIDATDAQLCILAQQYANECASIAAFVHDTAELCRQMEKICKLRGIIAPSHDQPRQVINRCTDPAWWRRQLRKIHGRSAEHAAIRLGFVSSQAGKYCSDEAVKRRIAQNCRNAKGLESVEMLNQDTGEILTLAQVASTGTGNKKNRRGEMMMRLAGCDEVAQSLGHKGIFVTLTAPSKYHAVLQQSGKSNPKYNGATPRDAQTYLNGVWSRTRAQNARDGIAPYGFRVAEPHHDGCTHWHALFFMPPAQIKQFIRNLSFYALQEDGDEAGAQASRVKYELIDPAKGGAASYMAKYVGKNIGTDEAQEDIFGNTIITKEMRVDAWAGVWGIRQFQPIGQPPVMVWRELRRVDAEQIAADAPDHIKQAHAACQRIVSDTEKDASGKPAVIHAASWAEYIQAQGGVNLGRDYRIALKTEKANVEGRYGLVEAELPKGIFCKSNPGRLYKSTRYTWKKSCAAVVFAFPWSPVNNCTREEFTGPWPGEVPTPFDEGEWFESLEADQVCFPDALDIDSELEKMRQFADSGRWPAAKAQPARQETGKGWDFSRRYNREGKLIRA